jgi:hypothetical protein
VKHALLITADGASHNLVGRFVLLTETAGKNKTLSVIDCYENGLQVHDGGIICDSLTEALDEIKETYKKKETT